MNEFVNDAGKKTNKSQVRKIPPNQAFIEETELAEMGGKNPTKNKKPQVPL